MRGRPELRTEATFIHHLAYWFNLDDVYWSSNVVYLHSSGFGNRDILDVCGRY